MFKRRPNIRQYGDDISVIKELTHAFSCAYIELWLGRALKKLELLSAIAIAIAVVIAIDNCTVIFWYTAGFSMECTIAITCCPQRTEPQFIV